VTKRSKSLVRYALEVAYDGRKFHGFAKQSGVPTVQDEIEKALARLYRKEIRVDYASRTDAGVHALGQVVAYDAEKKIETRRIPDALNFYLPEEIRVFGAKEVRGDFSPRRDAKNKLYRYVAFEGAKLLPHLKGLCLPLGKRLDISALVSACELLKGEHDFASLVVKQEPHRSTTVRLVRVSVRRCDPFAAYRKEPFSQESVSISDGEFLVFELEAERFLYKMVRCICGLLVRVGEGSLGVDDVKAILEGRMCWGPVPLPPDGLFLVRIDYGDF